MAKLTEHSLGGERFYALGLTPEQVEYLRQVLGSEWSDIDRHRTLAHTDDDVDELLERQHMIESIQEVLRGEYVLELNHELLTILDGLDSGVFDWAFVALGDIINQVLTAFSLLIGRDAAMKLLTSMASQESPDGVPYPYHEVLDAKLDDLTNDSINLSIPRVALDEDLIAQATEHRHE